MSPHFSLMFAQKVGTVNVNFGKETEGLKSWTAK